MTREEVAQIKAPVLIAVGTKDDDRRFAGKNSQRSCPDARALDHSGRDHMLAVGDKIFKTACSRIS